MLKLPFIVKVFKFKQILFEQFCRQGSNIKIVFSTFELPSPFSARDMF